MTKGNGEPNPDADPEVSAASERPLSDEDKAMLAVMGASVDVPTTVDWTWGEREGRRMAGLLLKRTYTLVDGRLELDEAAQETLSQGEIGYFDDEKSVRLAPPLFVNDYYAARLRTDVVVQGFAYAPRPNTRKLTARLRFGKHEREIVVFGTRRGEYDRGGRPRFSEPQPFDEAPLRYDFAYGGVDMIALARKLGYPEPGAEVEVPAETEFHYPRNPCGLGYLIELDRDSFDGLVIPRLEHPFDPLTPERLAVGAPDRWLRGPLPAAWDWQSQTWFPRAAYFGMAPDFARDGTVPAEVERGWAPRDILDIPMIFHKPEGPLRVDFAQGASAGMSFTDVAPDELFVLENLHPKESTLSMRLPGEVPQVKVAFESGTFTDLVPRLLSVVLRPDQGEVVTVWCALAEVGREYQAIELYNMDVEIRWARGGAK
jgi:hypothetical protein